MPSPKNVAVYNALRKYTIQALKAASEELEQDGLHVREVAKWIRVEGQAFRREVVEQRDPWLFLLQMEEKLSALPEYLAAKEALSADSIFGPQLDTLVGTVTGGYRIETRAVLNGFVADALRRNSFDLDEDSFDQKYVEIESAFYSDQLPFKLCMPVVGLTIEQAPVSLAPGLELDRLTEDEISILLEHDVLQSRFPALDGVAFIDEKSQFGIRLRFQLKKRVGKEFNESKAVEAQELFERQELSLQSALHALRLLKDDTVAPAGRLTITEGWFMRGQISYGRSMITPFAWANNYSLSKQDAQALRELWTKLSSERVKRHPALALAVRRFALADDRILADDKLLDLMISAEALLLSDAGSEQDRGELTYRLSLRAAFLLANNAAERRAIFLHMRRAYGARSKIAHGGALSFVKLPDGTTAHLFAFAKTTREKIRQMILIMIDRAPEQGPMIDWESLILG